MNAMTATETGEMIRREIGDDGVCVLAFDRPNSGANIFDAAAIEALDEQLDFIEADGSLKGVIVTSAKKSIFVAGADLQTLLRHAQTGELRAFIASGQRVFNRLAALQIPSCAAIHGASAGGGYEVALACDWRVATDDPATRIGLPETTLGLVPAWGGATRLPRLIGLKAAAEVILKGKLHAAADAVRIGLVDEAVPQAQLIAAARKKLAQGKRKPSVAPQTEAEVKPPRDPAGRRALDAMQRGLQSSIEESLQLELDAIVDLGESEATQNLIRNFFLADKYRKGTSKTKAEKIAHAAVIGAGVMGSGIAQWLSSRGVSVILRDLSSEQLDRGLANIEKTYGDAVKRGLMPEEKAKEGRARVVASTATDSLRDVEVVIEAASEKFEIKSKIFSDLADNTGAKAILATNTSALPISKLAAATKSPERVIGLHFFNPVSRMKLIEVVVAEQTSDATRDRALGFARQIGKVPVVVRDGPGFLVNRVLFPYLLDAAELYMAGMEADEIDSALVKWGMPMGPLRLIDEIGVDITVDIAHTLENAYGRRGACPKILREMQSAKLLGRKSGAGFYKYEGKEQMPNESLAQWRTHAVISSDVEKSRGENSNENPRGPSTALRSARDDRQDELTVRLVMLMVNESAMCLEEKVVAAPEDADYGMILGTGFAPHRGGPLRYAEYFGIAEVVRELDRLAAVVDVKFTPCELLRRHAREGTKFYEDTARSAA